ncbi:AAA family ATPase [Salinivibrio kushneri]|uniref:AAA family ATPase n=1 Tax=Salinivibrio kushneri TaxID=1908198 RepID=A0AA47LS45_9GAMM|nr:AAA family ATPase [Salinivibrio kushneri]WBA08852.1 AAA family ATPase [Salinivibrio kushneri]
MTDTFDTLALDLESQTQLLSRLQFITRFSANLIQVTGPEGAGKTWLSERYMEQWADAHVHALLACHTAQSDAQRRAILLRQIVKDGVFNEADPLIDSLTMMLDGGGCDALLVIDDAHRLTPGLLSELWALVQHAQHQANWRINVVLFALPGKLNKWLGQVSYGHEQKPLELEVSPLNEGEAEMFIDVLAVTQRIGGEKKKQWLAKLANQTVYPGTIMGKENQETGAVSKDKKKPAKNNKPFLMLILAVVLMILGAGAIWWVFPSQQDDSASEMVLPEGLKNLDDLLNEQEEQTITDPQTATQTGAQPSATNAGAGTDTIASPSMDNGAVTEDQATLPEDINGEGLTVGRSDEGQRVVVPDDVVDAIIDEQDAGGDGTDAVDEPLASEISEAVPAPAAPQASTSDTAQDEQTASEDQASTSANRAQDAREPGALPLVPQALLNVSAQRYALQLAALQSRADAVALIENYQLADRVQVYQTQRNNATWYMVLLGDYASVTEARRAELNLADNVRALQPFVKSFSQIHREINRANGQ